MKKLILLFLIVPFFACQSNQKHQNSKTASTTGTYAKLDVAAFNQKLQATTEAQLIDVRTPEEFQQGHIDGAVNINFYRDDFKDQMAKLNKTQAVFVYCKSGGRSGKSLNQLKDMAFSTVYDLKGGFTAWKKAQ